MQQEQHGIMCQPILVKNNKSITPKRKTGTGTLYYKMINQISVS
jgi:hypothetical protein